MSNFAGSLLMCCPCANLYKTVFCVNDDCYNFSGMKFFQFMIYVDNHLQIIGPSKLLTWRSDKLPLITLQYLIKITGTLITTTQYSCSIGIPCWRCWLGICICCFALCLLRIVSTCNTVHKATLSAIGLERILCELSCI